MADVIVEQIDRRTIVTITHFPTHINTLSDPKQIFRHRRFCEQKVEIRLTDFGRPKHTAIGLGYTY